MYPPFKKNNGGVMDNSVKGKTLAELILKTKRDLHNSKLYHLTINSTEKDKYAVPVGINGHIFNIPRDIQVIVPEQVVQVLQHCIVDDFALEKSENGMIKMKETKYNRIPFSAMPLNADEEKAYKAKHYGIKAETPKAENPVPQDDTPDPEQPKDQENQNEG
jgi:hypothetical protein